MLPIPQEASCEAVWYPFRCLGGQLGARAPLDSLEAVRVKCWRQEALEAGPREPYYQRSAGAEFWAAGLSWRVMLNPPA